MKKSNFFTPIRIILYLFYFITLITITLINNKFNKKPLELKVNNYFEKILTPYNYSKVEKPIYDIEYKNSSSHIECSIQYTTKNYTINKCSLFFDQYEDNIFDIIDKIKPNNKLRKFQEKLQKIIKNKEYETLSNNDLILIDNKTSECINIFKSDYNSSGYRILISF